MRLNLFAASILVSIASTDALAEDYCAHLEREPADLAIPESAFSKEEALMAAKFLQSIVEGTSTTYEWFEPPNALRLVEGHLFYRQIEIARHNGTDVNGAIASFCQFLEKKGYYYD